MKLFIVGSDRLGAIETYYVKYLRDTGVNVMHFPAQSIFFDYYQRNIPNKLMYRLGLSSILQKININFKKAIEEFTPDIIWIFKGMEIFPQSLQWAKSKGIVLVNYNADSPFIFSGKGSGNKNVTVSIDLYDLFLTYNKEDKQQMEIQHHIRSEILPFGYDLKEEVFNEGESLKEVKKVCFLGNPDRIRAKFLTDLAKLNVKIDVYGFHWNRVVNHPNITIYNPVYKDDFWRTLRKYRVQLNLLRPHNLTTHNMRTFEAGGVGAIQLAPDTPDHRFYFKENEEIFLFNDVTSCCQKIDYLMNLPLQEAKQIRENVRNRSLNSGYDYKSRSDQALAFLKSIDDKK